MNSKNLIITQYPLSTTYVDEFVQCFQDNPRQIVVSNVTARGYLDVLRYFRGLSAETIYIPVIDETGHALIPPLQILALLARANRRFIVSPDLSLKRFGGWHGVAGVLLIADGVIRGTAVVMRDWLRLRALAREERISPRLNGRKAALYLKTNLWLGVQAGGSVAHTSGVIGAFLRKGYEVDFASAEKLAALPSREGLHLHSVKPPRTYIVPRELNHYRHNANFIRSVLGLAAGRYGFIYQRLSLGNYTGVVLSRLRKLPLVIEYNGSEVWLARNWGTPLSLDPLASAAETVCLHHAHLIVTVSDVLKEELIKRGVEPDRVVAYPNGVDPIVFDPDRFSPDEIAAARRHFGIPVDAIVATFVGTFGHWHGAKLLARAVCAMAETDSAWMSVNKVHVVFIGDGVKRPIVESILSSPDLRPYFTIAGLIRQEDTPLYMAASDILVSPHVPNPDGSPFFGSPTKLFEYLATGRAVVASDLFQIGDVLRGCPHVSEISSVGFSPTSEQCGILVKPEDTNELAAALKFLVENPEWRRAAGRNARLRALSRYTWDHHVGVILGRLDTLLSRDHSGVQAKPPRRPIRVLVNGLHSKTGGGLTYLRNVLPLLAADPEVEISLCIHEDQKDLLPDGLENITVEPLSFRLGFWRLLIREQIELPRLARRIGAEVTFSPANYGPLGAPNPVILLRNALSVAFVERRPVKLLYWALVYIGTAFSLMACRRAIAVSNYARNSAGGLLNFLIDRIAVVPHGVSPMFSPLNGQPRRQEEFLLAVSDIYVQKNLRNLLLALARLKHHYPRIRLKIAGSPVDEDYFRTLQRTVKEEGLEENVEFLGHVAPAQLVDLYRHCSVFVFPSSVETFGNPLVEAMACGAPIASSNTAAMPEVVGDAALFFDPSRVEDIVQTLDRLLKDDTLRRELGKRAAARARRYSWEQTAAETLEVIKEAAASK